MALFTAMTNKELIKQYDRSFRITKTDQEQYNIKY